MFLNFVLYVFYIHNTNNLDTLFAPRKQRKAKETAFKVNAGLVLFSFHFH